MLKTCPSCQGKGKDCGRECDFCRGKGLIDLPAGKRICFMCNGDGRAAVYEDSEYLRSLVGFCKCDKCSGTGLVDDEPIRTPYCTYFPEESDY